MNELSLFDSLFNNSMDNVFNGFGYRTSFVPKVDVKETDENYELEMELPGRNENDVNIELDGNSLTISSKKAEEKTSEEAASADNAEKSEKPAKWLIRERYLADFRRNFTIPEDVDNEAVSASFKNGILSIKLPRKPVAQPKRITINCA